MFILYVMLSKFKSIHVWIRKKCFVLNFIWSKRRMWEDIVKSYRERSKGIRYMFKSVQYLNFRFCILTKVKLWLLIKNASQLFLYLLANRATKDSKKVPKINWTFWFWFFFLKILAQILLLTLFSNRNMKKMKIPFWSEVKVVP